MEPVYPDILNLFCVPPNIAADDNLAAVRFYSHRKDYTFMSPAGVAHWTKLNVKTSIFSNLYPCDIVINDEESTNHFLGKYTMFPSTEHYFQMWKYSDADRSFMIKLNSGDVASYGQRRLRFQDNHISILRELSSLDQPLPKMSSGRPYELKSVAEPKIIIHNWDTQSIKVMYTALRAKFSQHEQLAQALVATKGCWLIEHTKNDVKWADGDTGHGTNFLGKLLMYTRQEIIDKCEYQYDVNFMKTPMNQLIKY
eukprot:TRINITY_DN18202_c0_g1_i1.p1 TRINITY_DN18202_c0_g1~~TRINITY_DN18202_c0_g1_i1.p1  ORF type:complete len:254 (-),score=32.66 TRINITY_DN18202_c0_g1_i1:2-763(-)